MKKVIIIGGGVAGLSAARRLIDSGKFEVQLLEGSCRLGGRVHSKKFGDYFIEDGAQWVHGEEGNQVFKLASSMNLLDKGEDVDEDTAKERFLADSMFVTNNRWVLKDKIHEKAARVIAEILEGPEDNQSDGSVGEWAAKVFEKEINGDLDPDRKYLNGSVLDWIHRFQASIDGCDNWFQSSLRGQHEYWECEGNPTVSWKPPASYSSLLGILVTGAPTLSPYYQPELPPWIEIGREVNRIEVHDNFVSVQCSDGARYTGHHIISTVSLGVLKNIHTSLFQPSLPEKKVRAIENLGIGCVNKLHFDFKTRWWPAEVYGFSFLWEDANEVQEYWRSDIDDDTLNKEVDGLPLWTRNILGFYQVSSHPTALNSWITGPAARLIESMSDEEVQDAFMKVLKFFLRNSFDVPDPEDFCRSKWGTNRFTMGSYSFRQMNSEMNDVWAKDLAEPILNRSGIPVICFAGEATHDHFYSTVHGAFETGKREADRLVKLVWM